MKNFLEKNNVESVDVMYGKEVYFSLFPDDESKYIYKGKLLGYGAYGKNPEHKTFCIFVERGDGYRFVDYFMDRCFKSKAEYEAFTTEQKEKNDPCYSVDRLIAIAKLEQDHIPVKVKVGEMVYPVCGIAEQAKSVKEPAFVLKADMEEGEWWATE